MKNNGRSLRIRALFLGALCALVFIFSGWAQAGWIDLGRELLHRGPSTAKTFSSLSSQEMAAGLKEALKVGSERVVEQLGVTDGFNADPAIHIPLPDQLATANSILNRVGMGGHFNDLELRLNRAAEAATPQAKELFWKAISEMTLADVQAIYNGPQDAATRYFQEKMSPELERELRPVVDRSLADIGAVQIYNRAMAAYRTIPFTPAIETDLTGYVVKRGTEGIFHYLAVEEAAIRQDPTKQTTELLRRVFGGP